MNDLSSEETEGDFANVVSYLTEFFSNEETLWRFGALLRAALPKISDKLAPEIASNLRRGDIQFKLRNEIELTADEVRFLQQFLANPQSQYPVKKRGRQASKNSELATLAVEIARRKGLNLFRNDTSPETSACDAVAEAFRRLSLSPTSYSGVKSVYLANRNQFSQAIEPKFSWPDKSN